MTDFPSRPQPINRTTLSSQVTEQLRGAILAGIYEPGAQLNEAELARQFGVSRGPLREAMQRLIQEGLLRSRPHHGVFVPELTNADLADIYFAREAVETAALRRVMSSGKAVQVAKKLAHHVDKMIAALAQDDWATVVDHDLSFHAELVNSADSHRLSRMYSVLIAETRLCLNLLVSGYLGRRDFIEEHQTLAERLAEEDTSGALRAIRKHLHEPLKSLTRQRALKDKLAVSKKYASGES